MTGITIIDRRKEWVCKDGPKKSMELKDRVEAERLGGGIRLTTCPYRNPNLLIGMGSPLSNIAASALRMFGI